MIFRYHSDERSGKTEHQVERVVSKIYGKCGVNGGKRTGQDKVEQLFSIPFRRLPRMGKAREVEEDYYKVT